MLQGKTAEAIKNFDKAIALDPNYRDAYDQRGNLRGRHGDFTGAIADFQQAVRISPDLAPGHYNLGHAYYFIGDLENSSKELEIALGLDPNFATAYFIRGLVRHAQGHNAEATNDFRKSLGFNFPDAAFWIFICESEDGLADTAHKDLTDALNTPEAFKRDDFPTAIGNFLLGSLSQDQLLARAQAANGENRDDFTCASWFYAGASQRLAGNKAGARDCFKKAIDTNSKASEEYIEAQREIATLPGL
jgi:tetratricopeptide (TPR) repeat protein